VLQEEEERGATAGADESEIETLVCADCGGAVAGGVDRGFPFGPNVLCWECALRRGGRYDAQQDRWTVAPDLSDLRRRLQREP
jgi:hypothetical protein